MKFIINKALHLQPMQVSRIALSALCLALVACSSILPKPEQSQPSQQRITDRAIFADQKGMQALQDRLANLNQKGVNLDSYTHAKAQCWLDSAAHEYHRNDRSGFIEYALKQSSEGIQAMESGNMPGTLEQAHPEACAQGKRACQEVAQYHAEHEEKQFGWRHARPYYAIAQDLGRKALSDIEACKIQTTKAAVVEPPLAPVVAAITVPALAPAPQITPQAPAPAAVIITKLVLQSEALFSFNRSALSDLSPGGKSKLDALIGKLQEVSIQSPALKVKVTGYADGIGAAEYNQGLSEKRANTVREYLLQSKISPSKITAVGAGMTSNTQCSAGDLKQRAACLAADRRVEIEVTN